MGKLQAGSRVTRMLCGSIPQVLLVTEMTEDVIYCGSWKFCAKTGDEIDEGLGWGPPPLGTGSFLKELQEQN
jgi:hypothetical protein